MARKGSDRSHRDPDAEIVADLTREFHFKNQTAVRETLTELRNLRTQESAAWFADLKKARSELSKMHRAARSAKRSVENARLAAAEALGSLGYFGASMSAVERLLQVEPIRSDEVAFPHEFLAIVEIADDPHGNTPAAIEAQLESWASVKLRKTGRRGSDNVLLLKALAVCRRLLDQERLDRARGEGGLGWTFKSLGQPAIRESNDPSLLQGVTERAVCSLLLAADIPFTFREIHGAYKRIKLPA